MAGGKIILAGGKIIWAGGSPTWEKFPHFSRFFGGEGDVPNWIVSLFIRSSLYPITSDTIVTGLVYYVSDQAFIP